MRMIGFINPTLRQLESELTASELIDFAAAHSIEELREKAAGAEAALVSNSTYGGAVAEVLRAAPNLRWIQTTSIGVDSVIANPPREGVIVTNAAGLKAPTVAEHAVMLLLALSRNLGTALRMQKEGRWATQELAPGVRSLASKRVLCLGYGAIGRDVARKLLAFDALVTAVTRSGNGPPPATDFVAFGKLDEILPRADAVVLALPLAPETRHVIGRDRIARMKPGALLVNVGRGELIDEAALAEALRQGHLGGAALDVFSIEPLPEESPLWHVPRTVITPHLGGQGGDGDRLLVWLIHQNADRLRRGEILANIVAVS
jgi:phosphoglycerate dehydrogenase-like enzyme